MIDFSSISHSTLTRGDDRVSGGISISGGIPFGSTTIYNVYVCTYFVLLKCTITYAIVSCVVYNILYICWISLGNWHV